MAGDANDPAYVHVRDEPHLASAKDFTEVLWQKCASYSDPHARSDARNHFLQRFWEMYLTCTFLERGLNPVRVGSEGPEFFVMINNTRVWIEAITPEAGSGDDKVPDIVHGDAYSVPTEKILLRFTHALVEKNKKYKAAVSKGIIHKDEPIILAINSRAIPHSPHEAELPYFIKAFLPIGNLQIPIDTRTMKAGEASYRYSGSLSKMNGSSVSTTSFLNSEFAHFSAVIHSGVDCANHPEYLGADFSVLHNPTSLFRIPEHIFSWCKQFKYEEDVNKELSITLI